MSTFERLKGLLQARLAIDSRAATPDCTLESFGLDSLARLELLFELEEEFDVRLAAAAQEVRTLGDVVAAIENGRRP